MRRGTSPLSAPAIGTVAQHRFHCSQVHVNRVDLDGALDSLRESLDVALETFGCGRLMFGSDWPVCNVGGGYRRQHEAFEELLAPLDTGAAEDLRWRSACRAYGLDSAGVDRSDSLGGSACQGRRGDGEVFCGGAGVKAAIPRGHDER